MRPPSSGPTDPPRDTLRTPRLRLRDWEKTDWSAIHEMMSDVEVARYAFPPVTDAEQTHLLVSSVVQARQSPLPHGLVITLIQTDEVIGTCRLSILKEGNGQGDIAYHLLRRYWGQGYATEAAQALLQYGFDDFGLHRISTSARPENIASWRVLEKIGMRREGHQRLHRWDWIAQEWVDSYLYAIVEDEWRMGKPLS